MTPEVTYWRQRDILSPQQMEGVSVTLIGAGGIGSPTALCLAKMGISRMTVYDHDVIDEHNLPNQMYPPAFSNGHWQDAIGMKKTEALNNVIKYFKPDLYGFHVVGEKYEDQPLEGIVISAVDSMSARRTIFDGVFANRDHIKLYIEARMGAEIGMVYAFKPSDLDSMAWYEQNMLYTDADSLPIPCTATAILYNTFMISALIGRQVKNYLTGGFLPREVVMDINNLSLMRSEPR